MLLYSHALEKDCVWKIILMKSVLGETFWNEYTHDAFAC